MSQPPSTELAAPTVVLSRSAIANAAGPVDRGTRHIPEIDGLRGIAIILIVIYHVWLNRVSGGVDVFLLLSGFLITMSLMRSADRHGRVQFAAFYARIARRIFPPALVVLVGVVVATVVWLPQTRWRDTLGDVIASALYVVNWRLAENAVDYLASRNAASPVQHYWSLAVQAQFYVVWPLLIAVVTFIAVRLALHPRRVLATMLGTVLVVSLGYSVHQTATDQIYTYFDTFARVWEFALGGLLVLALPYLRLSRNSGLALGWVGLVALVVCGLVFRAGDQFPGWAALWPTVAAAMLIVTAGNGSRFGADRLLRGDALRRLGDHSYALYLWHWPVLICYLTVSGRSTASLRGGLLVIVASILLSIATKWLAEDRLRASGIGQRTTRGGFTLAASFLVAVLVTTAGWTGFINQQQQQRQAETAAWTEGVSGTAVRTYPGAAHLAYGGELLDVPYRPGPLDVGEDHAGALYPGCHQNQDDSEPIICELGQANAQRTIAVVGGSRAEHWLPALEELAEENRWQILAITKSGCLFSSSDQYPSCNEWNVKVMGELARLRPDAVFTTSTRVLRQQEHTPGGYVERWRGLDTLGIPVLAIRDIPRPLVDVPDCVETHGPTADACRSPIDLYGLDRAASVEQRGDISDNVSFLDLTELFCVDGFCPPVIGNVLVYHDNSHITATYARTLAPFLGDAILDATGWAAAD